MKLNITRKDLLKSKVIEPNWYPVEVVKVDEHPSKAGDSTNWDVHLEVLAPESIAGVTIIRTYSEKAPGFAAEFLTACGANLTEDGGSFEMGAAVGKKIQAKVINEMYNGTMRNKAESFRPLEG